MEFGLPIVLAGLAGAALVWLAFAMPARRRLAAADKRAATAEAALEAERKAQAARLEEIDKARAATERQFAALAAEALDRNSQAFLRLAGERFDRQKDGARKELEAREQAVAALVRPIREELEKFQTNVQEIEKSRAGAYQAVTEQVKALAAGQTQLRSETGRLVQALRQPQTRGRWGEHQLRNVLELADMKEHVDFVEQETLEDGSRPDVIVRLPGGKSIVIDAKTPLDAYLDAIETEDEEARARHLEAHARHVRTHVRRLASKEYWSRQAETPDFVVMFIPGESIYAAAFQQAPGLFDEAAAQKVLISTPTTLIALVKAVAYGWQQEKLAENAQAVARSGQELYKRVQTFGRHMESVGKTLKQLVERYNASVGSLERSILPQARRFEELGAAPAGERLPDLPSVETEPRGLQAPELSAPAKDAAKSDHVGMYPAALK